MGVTLLEGNLKQERSNLKCCFSNVPYHRKCVGKMNIENANEKIIQESWTLNMKMILE